MKSEYWAMLAGVIIGSILGIQVGLNMIKQHKQCNELKQENKMLREVILYQQQLYYNK